MLDAEKRLSAQVWLANPQGKPLSGKLIARLKDGAKIIATTEVAVTGTEAQVILAGLTGIALWEPTSPALYTLDLTLETPEGTDTHSERFGFRQVRFTTTGFHLNGKPLKLRAGK